MMNRNELSIFGVLALVAALVLINRPPLPFRMPIVDWSAIPSTRPWQDLVPPGTVDAMLAP